MAAAGMPSNPVRSATAGPEAPNCPSLWRTPLMAAMAFRSCPRPCIGRGSGDRSGRGRGKTPQPTSRIDRAPAAAMRSISRVAVGASNRSAVLVCAATTSGGARNLSLVARVVRKALQACEGVQRRRRLWCSGASGSRRLFAPSSPQPRRPLAAATPCCLRSAPVPGVFDRSRSIAPRSARQRPGLCDTRAASSRDQSRHFCQSRRCVHGLARYSFNLRQLAGARCLETSPCVARRRRPNGPAAPCSSAAERVRWYRVSSKGCDAPDPRSAGRSDRWVSRGRPTLAAIFARQDVLGIGERPVRRHVPAAPRIGVPVDDESNTLAPSATMNGSSQGSPAP